MNEQGSGVAQGKADTPAVEKNFYGFPATRWTLIGRAGVDDESLGELVSLYRDPVFAFLRRFTGDRQKAEDLTQQFFLRELEFGASDSAAPKGVIQRADPAKGRFRNYLMEALRHLALTDLKKHPDDPAPGGETDVEQLVDSAQASLLDRLIAAKHAFKRAWLLSRLQAALKAAEQSCNVADRHGNTKSVHFRCFVDHYLGSKSAPTPWNAVAEQNGVLGEDRKPDGKQARNLSATAADHFRRAMIDIIRHECPDDELADELHTLWADIGEGLD